MYEETSLKSNNQKSANTNVPDGLANAILSSGPGSIVIVDGESFKIVFYNEQFYQNFLVENSEAENAAYSFLNIIDPHQH